MKLLIQVNTIFERFVLAAHEHAPDAKLCFNTSPTTSLEAFQRVLRK